VPPRADAPDADDIMPTSFPAPPETAIEALLGSLVSAPTHVARTPVHDVDETMPGLLVEFLDEENALSVLAFADHDIVNYVGGAVSGVELERISAASGEKTVLDEGVEGLRPVLAALADCLNTEYTKSVRVGAVQALPAEPPEATTTLWQQPNGRRAYRVTVDEYGAGSLILYLS
jgi:hypothetical protein